LALLLILQGGAFAQGVACGELADLKVNDTNFLSSAVVPKKPNVPAYCRVLGYVRPAINFEIRLPVEDWNGKFYMAGCGGLCGSLPDDQPGLINYSFEGLERKYAVAVTDSGHWGADMSDARWAYDNPVARADYSYRAVTETARVAKAITEAYYGRHPRHSYFNGCSNGGRQALLEAQRFPEDFDGIIAASPITNSATFAAQWIWNVQADTDGQNRPILGPGKVRLLSEAVTAACADEEGVIADPRTCHFDPSVLRCEGRSDRRGERQSGESCLTAAEIAAVRKLYAGPHSKSGQALHEGLPLGSESLWITKDYTLLGPDGSQKITMENGLRYMMYEPHDRGPIEVMRFDLDRDLPKIKATTDLNRADDPELSRFKARGGKLLMYAGWADPFATPLAPIQYYEAVEEKLGGREVAQSTLRLFMVPGMSHCGTSREAPGIDERGIDALTALEQWVERDAAPAHLPTTKFDGQGRVRWTRPVCVYPQVATYGGSGAREESRNWVCAER